MLLRTADPVIDNRITDTWSYFTLIPISLLHQTGLQDYEIFNDQLDSLGCWIVEAEEALKMHDPNGATDVAVVQVRMEELKVLLFCFLLV